MPKKHVPKAFILDHIERDLPCPPLVHIGRNRYGIDPEHPAYAELVDDARYYAKDVDACERSLIRAARKLLDALGEKW